MDEASQFWQAGIGTKCGQAFQLSGQCMILHQKWYLCDFEALHLKVGLIQGQL
jgi:hypothetical protein